ncbi:unnamed protein product [Ambrosiozyma monospora]|uniref:Thiamine pyrophosphokinase n=1 Tax=Ambrosiozyma monospora TaxID=43982 RepID=A0A9W7DII5_AMBMO|nr:unnamed protein product [Ambrosiozyma monospora]
MSLEEDTHIIENEDEIHVSLPSPDDSNIHLINMSEFYASSDNKTNAKVLLILNQDINLPLPFFAQLWNQAELKICADGGSTRLLHYSEKHKSELVKNSQYLRHNNNDSKVNEFVPDYIVGDLDSLSETVRLHFQKLGTKIKQQSSQYAHDLAKSISLINLRLNCPELDIVENCNDHNGLLDLESKNIDNLKTPKHATVFVVGAIGGRFDQTISAITYVTKLSEEKPHFQFVLLNAEYMEFVLLLKKGRNFVHIKKNELFFDGAIATDRISSDGTIKLRNIGLLPLVNQVVLSTEGLKWDVKNWNSQVGGNVSSSNLIVGDNGLYVESSDFLFVNIEF